MDLSDVDGIQQQLNKLKLRINEQTSEIIDEAMPTPPPESRTLDTADPSEDLELVNTLWILKAGFQETASLIELEDIEAASQSLDRLDAKITEFTVAFPHTLLGIDIKRQAFALRTRIREFVAQKWSHIVVVTDNKVQFRDDAKGDEIVSLYPNTGTTIVAIGRLIDSILDLKVSRAKLEEGLELVEGRPDSLDAFVRLVETVTKYLSTAPPPALAQAIIRRYKSHIISEIVHRSVPKLYPTDMAELPAFKQQVEHLRELEKQLSEHGWTQSNELSHFAAAFESEWPTVRRGQFLARLRQLYKDVTPLTEATRRKLIKPPTAAPVDEWEWNDDDDDEQEGGDNGGTGSLVELWKEFTSELGPEHSEQFFILYRAITPTAYGSRSIWLYSDTMAFTQQAGPTAEEALAPFAYLYLHNYVRNHTASLDTELLPQLFGKKQARALNQLKAYIGNIAEESNAEGGPELRETILGQLVEQIAVYVVNSIEALEDIGDEESSELASLIAKLDSLAVFFRDVRLSVPSWYKMEMLGRVLMGNLASIQEMYNQHLLADFSTAELDGLLRALFVDSPTRQALIREIHESQNRRPN